MSDYIVSARKYRPMTFDSVVGQGSIARTLKNAISSGKLAQAYLFCGPRGVGKTTCARIFAKTINCLSPRADGEACNECESCKAFNDGRSLNIHELDAASNNSVDDIRALTEQVRIPPQIGKYKVFIIDEVHMLSTAAFNAFLKTLEEPPAHAIFILATTEKHKILPTILSRCQVYDFQRMSIDNIINHLNHVAQQEGYTAEPEALNVIAHKADGAMRDALSIFDQVVSFTGGDITYQRVIENLNVLNYDYYFRLVDMMLEQKISESLLLLNEILGKGFDGGPFISGLASHLRDVLVCHDAQTVQLLEASEDVRKRYVEQASHCKAKWLYRAIRLCNECDRSYRTSQNKRLQVELCLIECAQAVTDDDDGGAGRRPVRRLKPIFGSATVSGPAHSTASSHQSAPSVAMPPVANTQGQNSTSRQPRVSAPLKFGNLSPSIRRRPSVEEAPSTVSKVAPVAVAEEKSFTQNDLILEWQRFIQTELTDNPSVAQNMRIMKPTIAADVPNRVQVQVENEVVQQWMHQLQSRLTAFLQKNLHNSKVVLTFTVAEKEAHEHIYNKREQLLHLSKINPVLSSLVNVFELEQA